MGKFGWSLPPGVTTLPGEEEQCLDMTERLQARGKKGHGLCGKDADLDYGGQIKVEGCFLLEESVEAHLQVYATICPPEDEQEAEAYGDVVCTWFHPNIGINGEWTGDDWCFDLKNDEHFYRVTCPYEWNDEWDDETNFERAVSTIYDAIFDDPNIKAFQEDMTELAKAGEQE